MLILLDTHVLLWALYAKAKLSDHAAELLRSEANRCVFSAASIWEIAIKAQLSRNGFRADASVVAEDARAAGLAEFPITASVAATVSALPLHHHDPFDRLLVAQAMAQPARLLTANRALVPYSELVMLV
ncbi:MAG: type II toxin-antitoxin system VapC family toxin [bacterium]|nr:type II toxin-antitoxin system VapC family toxin [bacterium]